MTQSPLETRSTTDKYLARLIRDSHPEYDYRDDPDDIEIDDGYDHDHDVITIVNYSTRNVEHAYTPTGWQDAIDKSETLADYDHAMAELHKECIACLKA